MKVYEKLGLPYLTKEQYVSLDCLCTKDREGLEGCPERDCQDCVYNYLMSDVPTKKVKRWETYNGDFAKAYIEWRDNKRLCLFKSMASDDDCRKYAQCSECYNAWLMEEIEIEVA